MIYKAAAGSNQFDYRRSQKKEKKDPDNKSMLAFLSHNGHTPSPANPGRGWGSIVPISLSPAFDIWAVSSSRTELVMCPSRG
jgi:hypothetical protein